MLPVDCSREALIPGTGHYRDLDRRGDELSVAGVRGRLVELTEDLAGQRGMEASLEFIDEHDASVLDRLEDGRSDAEQGLRPPRLLFEG